MPPRKRGRTDNEAAAAPEEDGRDHISALPDDALEHILSLIPVQDAVRTCMLARRWRHIWKSTKGLCIVTPGSIQDIKEFVDHLLLIRAGSPMDTFQLRILNGMSDVDNARVSLWIQHVLACKARALQFEILGSVTWLKLKDIHLLFASQHLTRLHFSYVQFGDCFLNFSSCPALQDLHIRRCKVVAKRISSQSVKCLSIVDCHSSRITLPLWSSTHQGLLHSDLSFVTDLIIYPLQCICFCLVHVPLVAANWIYTHSSVGLNLKTRKL